MLEQQNDLYLYLNTTELKCAIMVASQTIHELSGLYSAFFPVCFEHILLLICMLSFNFFVILYFLYTIVRLCKCIVFCVQKE